MDSRITTDTVEFRRPFRLTSHTGPMPAGRYLVQMEEELIEGLSFPVWRRTSTMITPQGLPAGRLLQSFPVVPAELQVALEADAGSGAP
ncbi:MAG TPA: hypothetical protein VD970_09260 [Acetobacteraceae bacterium]|nr:hypothetical protein [Acetobacteraceae bacterium]